MKPGIAVVLIAAAGVLVGCSGTGGSAPSSEPTSAVSHATSLGVATSSASAPSLTPSTAPVPSSSTAAKPTPNRSSSPARTLRCTTIGAALGVRTVFSRTRSLPSGVELPRAVPTVQCAGRADNRTVFALGYANVTLAEYVTQLKQTGWSDALSGGRHLLDRSGARYEILATSVSGKLAVLYAPKA